MKGKPSRSRFREGPAMSNLRDELEPEQALACFEPLPEVLLEPPLVHAHAHARRLSFPIFNPPYPPPVHHQAFIKAEPPAYQPFFTRPPPPSTWSHPTFQFFYPSPPPPPPTTLSKEDYAVTLGRPPPPEEPFSSACSTPDPWRDSKPEIDGEGEDEQVKIEDSPLSVLSSPLSEDQDQDQDDYIPSSPSTPGYEPSSKSYSQSRNYAPPPPSFTCTAVSPPAGDPPAVEGTGKKFSRGFSKGRPESLPLGMKYQCVNCATTQTREWRRRKDQLLCNACGLYHAAHGRPRPKEIQQAAAGRRATMAKHRKQPLTPITPIKKPTRPRRTSKSTLSPLSVSPHSPLSLPAPASAESSLFTRRARMRSRAIDQLSMQSISEGTVPTAGPASAPAQTISWGLQQLPTLERRSFKRRRTVDGSATNPLETPASAEGSRSNGWPNVSPHYFAQPDGTVTPYFTYSLAPSPASASPALPSWNELAYGASSAHYMGWTPGQS